MEMHKMCLIALTETCPCPLSDDCSRRVSLESLYGTWNAFPSLNFPMTLTHEKRIDMSDRNKPRSKNSYNPQ